MDRIFTSLASLVVLLMLIALGAGLALHAADPRDPASVSAVSWYRTHFMLGLAVGLAVVLVNSIVVTYFIGTGRWCKEVVETYALDRSFLARGHRLKQRAFPYALVNMLVIIGVLALGGAADPSGNIQTASPGGLSWAQWHLAAGALALAIVGGGSIAEWRAIRDNQQLIAQVMIEVQRMRRERGLET